MCASVRTCMCMCVDNIRTTSSAVFAVEKRYLLFLIYHFLNGVSFLNNRVHAHSHRHTQTHKIPEDASLIKLLEDSWEIKHAIPVCNSRCSPLLTHSLTLSFEITNRLKIHSSFSSSCSFHFERITIAKQNGFLYAGNWCYNRKKNR